MDYPTMMRGLTNIKFDYEKCATCGGLGLMPIMCCNGHECGCMGMPVDYAECDDFTCACEVVSEEEIVKASREPRYKITVDPNTWEIIDKVLL